MSQARAMLGRLPWGLLGAMLAATVVESTIARLDIHLARPEAFDWRIAHRAARDEARDRDLLAFGSSLTQQSILPPVLETHAGLKARNLAVCGGRPAFAYYYLERAIRGGARPRAVVLDVHPAILETSYKDTHTGWCDVLDSHATLDLAWTARDPSFLAKTMLAARLPSVYHRFQIRAATLDTLAGKSWSHAMNNLVQVRNLNRNAGVMVGPRQPDYKGEVSETYRRMLLGAPGRVDPIEWRSLERFAELAARHDIRVFWLIPPFVPELQRGREEMGLDERYSRVALRFLARHANVTVVDARAAGFPPSVFHDACHLDPQGGYVLTRALGDIVRGALAGNEVPRWVRLGPYREIPIDVPLEDATQSLAAVQSMTAKRR